MFCKNCGKEIDDKADVCIHCGVATGSSFKIVGNNNWLVALLLCIFLGLLGAHRFYTGHIASAIVQLILSITGICTFISSIWVLLDLIQIICGNFKTADNIKLVR